MSDTPEQLYSRAARGEEEAASVLVELFYRRIYGWLRRLTGNDEDAADLTQTTFSRLWTVAEKFQGRSSFKTWLHGIGHHVYLDWRRRHRLEPERGEAWWQTLSAPEPGPSERVAERELASRLYEFVEGLEEETRRTVHLHYYEGLSIAETAEVLEVATSTVKYRLREAIKRLRSRLEEPRYC